MITLGFILLCFIIYFSLRDRRIGKGKGVAAKVLNKQHGVFCYVLFELSDGKHAYLQVPGKDYVEYAIGDEGRLKYHKTTFHSFEKNAPLNI